MDLCFFLMMKSLSCVWLFATPWTVACTRLLHPWDFSRQEYWSGFFPYSLVQKTCTDLLTINSDLHHTSTKDTGIQKQNCWPWGDLTLMGGVISMHIPSTWWVKNFSGWLFMVQTHTCCVKLLQLCPTLWNPIGYCLPGSYAHGILQARILH